jgi:hypothetical protein
MADKGLVLAGEFGGTSFYGITPLDNIFDFQSESFVRSL